MSVQDDLSNLIRPVVEDLGFEFVGLEYLSNPKNRMVRIYVDREPEGITVDDCADISHEVSALLDVEDPLAGQYSLEVSSPGIERPLFEPEHYRRFVGEDVRVELFAPVEGRRKLTGRLAEVHEDGISVEVDGSPVRVPFDAIRRGRLKPDMDRLLAEEAERRNGT
ncbi:MAG: ribosome maturation factor RimP [Wenzhouxiangellaceae bacterium]|nr:ribosome maturation factor RimP [Wenzhouxiangellaceae bacterium]